jgi:hypothetical protein
MTLREPGRDGGLAEDQHRCPCGCGRKVSNRFFACGPGWYRLPRDLRRPITGNTIGSAEHLAAMVDARRWFRENAPARGGR